MSVSSALMSVKEMAKGITYDDPIKTRYVLPVNVCVWLKTGSDALMPSRTKSPC